VYPPVPAQDPAARVLLARWADDWTVSVMLWARRLSFWMPVVAVSLLGCSPAPLEPAGPTVPSTAPVTTPFTAPATTVPEVEPLPQATGGACALLGNPAGPWSTALIDDAVDDLGVASRFLLEDERAAVAAVIAALEAHRAGAELSAAQRAGIEDLAVAFAPFCEG